MVISGELYPMQFVVNSWIIQVAYIGRKQYLRTWIAGLEG